MSNWVLNGEGEPYLCPFRRLPCTKECALYGTASVENDCAFSLIAEALVQVVEKLNDGLDVIEK